MANKKILLSFLIVFVSSFFLYSCKNQKIDQVQNDNQEDNPVVEEDFSEFNTYTDKLAKVDINITQTKKFNEEFKVNYKTYEPEGVGEADFKAKSIKKLASIDDRVAQEGYKLVLAEISIKGNSQNVGRPFTFNQIGDYPSPQFVLIDAKNNLSQIETTYFSDIYTSKNNMYELSKISMDSPDWVHTAVIFEVKQDFPEQLALRFTNPKGETEFYEIN
jgi:hypothetical protein